MQKLKSRKRLTSLVLAFMLVFIVGAAFAFAPGTLDIEGRMHMATDYVVWNDVSETMVAPLGFPVGATQNATIVNNRNRTDQTIEWTVFFTEAGSATLTATAYNNSNLPVELDFVDAEWSFEGGFTAADFGLTETVDDTLFLLMPLGPAGSATAESMPLMVTVDWDGNFPDLDDADPDLLEETGPTLNTYLFAATLTVTFGYAPL